MPIIVLLFLLSLFASVILFYWLQSYASIESEGIKLGGAGAAFVVKARHVCG